MAQIETLMLANHAESLNGLLYVHGGGWSHHWRPGPTDQAPPSQFAIAATFLLEPTEAQAEQTFALVVTDTAGNELMRADGNLGANPAAGSGPAQRTSVALNATMVFPTEGAYTLTAEIAGAPGRTLAFWVHDQPDQGADSPPDTGYDAPTGGYL
jgi:hypothetical protein